MTWKFALVTLLMTAGAPSAAPDDVRAKELFYNPGTPELPARKTTANPSTRLPKAGPRAAARNIGLKCSIQLRNNSGEWDWVSPERPFYSGEHILIHVESNTSGWITILQKQDDGTPELLFPDRQMSKNGDLVEARSEVKIPLVFDEHPGKIRLFVLLRTEKSDAARTASPDDSKALLAQAETVSRSKGLRIDVDTDASQPAKFTVRPAAGAEHEEGVATEMTLDHRSGSGKRNRP
jgi:hypothetical protein